MEEKEKISMVVDQKEDAVMISVGPCKISVLHREQYLWADDVRGHLATMKVEYRGFKNRALDFRYQDAKYLIEALTMVKKLLPEY